MKAPASAKGKPASANGKMGGFGGRPTRGGLFGDPVPEPESGGIVAGASDVPGLGSERMRARRFRGVGGFFGGRGRDGDMPRMYGL